METPDCPRCDLTDLPQSMCAHCQGHQGIDEETSAYRAALIASGAWIAARYPGDCVECGAPFVPGDAIRRQGEGWRAECCGPDRTQPMKGYRDAH